MNNLICYVTSENICIWLKTSLYLLNIDLHKGVFECTAHITACKLKWRINKASLWPSMRKGYFYIYLRLEFLSSYLTLYFTPPFSCEKIEGMRENFCSNNLSIIFCGLKRQCNESQYADEIIASQVYLYNN